jgi:hypothetical protein
MARSRPFRPGEVILNLAMFNEDAMIFPKSTGHCLAFGRGRTGAHAAIHEPSQSGTLVETGGALLLH